MNKVELVNIVVGFVIVLSIAIYMWFQANRNPEKIDLSGKGQDNEKERK